MAPPTVRVHPLQTARMKAMPDFYSRPPGPLGTLRGFGLLVPRSRWFWIPIPAGQDWRLLDPAEDEIDVLGDGSIVLMRTPGHTVGHRSVVLRLAGGRQLLLTGDAAYSQATIDEDLLPLLAWRDDAFRSSL